MTQMFDVLEYYNVELDGQYKACCPLPDHEENTPSFTVYEETDSWSCFGACATGGNALTFIKHMEDWTEDKDFPKVIKKLAEILDMSEDEVMKEQEVKAPKKKDVIRITKDEFDDLASRTKIQDIGYRGIETYYDKFFGVRTEFTSDGKVKARYYPECYVTEKGQYCCAGYKQRIHPKDFNCKNVGYTGINNALSGQGKFSDKVGRDVLIVGGEEDVLAAYQMLDKYKKGNWDTLPVVSPTTGEGSAAKQVANNYEFLNRFENIYIGMDNDNAGRKAAKAIAEVLPKHKVRIISWSMNDPSAMLQARKHEQFKSDFWNAREYIPSSIKTSANMMKGIKELLSKPRIPLPPFMREIEDDMSGGIIQGRVVNIIAQTSVGKSSLVDACVYYWTFNAPIDVGIVSKELTIEEYNLNMLSIHMGESLDWKDRGELLTFLETDERAVKARHELETNEEGKPRYTVLDERGGGIKSLEDAITQMHSKYGNDLIVIDVTSDILRGFSNEDQEAHMKWQKDFTKSGVTIINVLHTRKIEVGKDGKTRTVNEYDAIGSSTFVQSAHINIILERDKEHPDEVMRNTTKARMPKCRGGKTGNEYEWYYDHATRSYYNKGDYFNASLELTEEESSDVEKGEVFN